MLSSIKTNILNNNNSIYKKKKILYPFTKFKEIAPQVLAYSKWYPLRYILNSLKITTLYSPRKKHSITNQSHFNNKIDLYPKKNLFLDPQQVSPVHNLKREKTLDLFSERFSHSRTWYRDGGKGTFDSLISPGDVVRIRYTSASPIHSICLHYLVDKVERWWSAFFSALVPFATSLLDISLTPGGRERWAIAPRWLPLFFRVQDARTGSRQRFDRVVLQPYRLVREDRTYSDFGY